MKLKHIEAFNAIMSAGSISGAARLLNVTQPAVTQTLQHAELQLGFSLFVRGKNGLTPTREARHLYARSRLIFDQILELKRLAEALKVESDSQMRVGIVPSLSTKYLSQALGAFHKKHPQSVVSFKVLHSDEIAKAVAAHECDLGIAYGEFSVPELESEVIGHGHLVWAEQIDAVAEEETPPEISISEIASRDFIGIDKDDRVGRILLNLLSEQPGFTQTKLSAQTYQSALLLTLDGFGPCVIDSFTANLAKGASVRCRPLVPQIPVHVSGISTAESRLRSGFSDLLGAFKESLTTLR